MLSLSSDASCPDQAVVALQKHVVFSLATLLYTIMSGLREQTILSKPCISIYCCIYLPPTVFHEHPLRATTRSIPFSAIVHFFKSAFTSKRDLKSIHEELPSNCSGSTHLFFNLSLSCQTSTSASCYFNIPG